MDIVYIFIKSQSRFSLQCFQITGTQEKNLILSLPCFNQPNTTKKIYISYGLCFPQDNSINARYDHIREDEIIEIEHTVDNEANARKIITELKTQFPKMQVADAFPRCGTLSLIQQSTKPPIKIVPDSSISALFNQGNIKFSREHGGRSKFLFPNYRLTSDQIKQTKLGECAFAAIITGFCSDRPYTIYNCMRDNLDGSILVRLYSYDPSTSTSTPHFYLIEKSKLISTTTNDVLTGHFLWADILLKAYAFHILHLRQQAIASAPSAPSASPQKLSFEDFLLREGINYIDLAHALTGNQKIDFFGQPSRIDKNFRTRAVAHKIATDPTQSCITLLTDLKKFCCPVYLCALQDHFGGAPHRVISGNTVYAQHAYCVLKVKTDYVTLLNPWQHRVAGQTDADHTSHLRYSLHPSGIATSSSSPAAPPSDSTAMLQSDEQELEPTLYDADAENYSGAIKIHRSDLLIGFDTIHVCKPETLWNQIKNEIVKILQAYMQFAGYHAGLAAILQRVFLNYLSDDMPLTHLAQIVEELYAIDQSLDTFHLIITPIQIFARELNSFLPADKRVVPVTTASAHPKNFSLCYAGELNIVHTQMNELYKPYRKLFQMLHSESSRADFNSYQEYESILLRFRQLLALMSDINIQMYGETLLTYAVTIACSYQSPIILNFFELLLSKNPSLVKPNKENKSPLRVIFEKVSHLNTTPLLQDRCSPLLILARQIIFQLRSRPTEENQAELKQIEFYIASLDVIQANALRQLYANAHVLDQNQLVELASYAHKSVAAEESAAFMNNIQPYYRSLRCLRTESNARAQLLHSEALARASLTPPTQWNCRQCGSTYPLQVSQCSRCTSAKCPKCGNNVIHQCCTNCGYTDPSLKFFDCHDNSDDDTE